MSYFYGSGRFLFFNPPTEILTQRMLSDRGARSQMWSDRFQY